MTTTYYHPEPPELNSGAALFVGAVALIVLAISVALYL